MKHLLKFNEQIVNWERNERDIRDILNIAEDEGIKVDADVTQVDKNHCLYEIRLIRGIYQQGDYKYLCDDDLINRITLEVVNRLENTFDGSLTFPICVGRSYRGHNRIGKESINVDDIINGENIISYDIDIEIREGL